MPRSASVKHGPAARIVTKPQYFSCKVSAPTKGTLMSNAWKTMIYLQGVMAGLGLDLSGLPEIGAGIAAENAGGVAALNFGENAGDLAKLGIAARNIDAKIGDVGLKP